MQINTYIPKLLEKKAKKIRSEIGWSDLIFAVISLWFADLKFKHMIKKFNERR